MNKKRIYLTVDTECHNLDLLNSYITGETKDGNYGLEKILSLAKELDIPINIFLDIPESHRYGKEYTKQLVDLINRYEQPIFLHLHPDFIYGDERKHLWEYTKEEQKELIKVSINDYIEYCGEKDRLVFRAGAWGVNEDTYSAFEELGINVLDLSFVNMSRFRCQLSCEQLKSQNAARKYHNVIVQPNTTYIGVDYFGYKYAFVLSLPGATYDEFKKIIRKNSLHNVIYSMHSWDLLKKWFFMPNYLRGDKMLERRLKRCVKYAKKMGYEFSNLNDYQYIEEEDQCINLCDGIRGKITEIFNNYFRFMHNGRSYCKYFLIYISPILILLFILVLILL